MKILQCIATLLLISSHTAVASTTPASSKQAYASYVILGEDAKGRNVAIARTVIDPVYTCPNISAPGKRMPSLTMTTRDNPNHFAVIVCEAVIGFDIQYQLNFSDTSVALPLVKSNPKNIQVFGDTGCKSSVCPLGQPAQPFKSLADSGASDQPDLVLHMGDYNYRGTGGQISFSSGKTQTAQWPYDAGDVLTKDAHCGQLATDKYYSQSATNSNHPDLWQYWHDDLFQSAKNLMAAAPWIVARGNHELCSRAGPGYFYFLDPHSNLIQGQKQLSCPTPDVDKSPMDNSVQIPSYVVSFNQLDIAVLDSANACDGFTDSPFTKLYTQQFSYLATQVGNNPTWLMTHRPIWGVEAFEANQSTACDPNNASPQYACFSQMMQQAIKNQPSQELPNSIDLVLSGHMHKFESVSFGKSRPANVVVGSSGVSLSGTTPAQPATVTVDGIPAQVLTTNTQITKDGKSYGAFGFMKMQYKGRGGWDGQLVNPPKGLVIANCTSKQNLQNGVCELADGIGL